VSRRRKLLIWGLSFGIPVVLALLAWFWWLPAAARGKALDAAERRGLDAEIGGASMRLSGVVLEEVVVTGRHGGLEIRVGELGVEASLFGLAFSGAAAIEGIQARDVAVRLDLHQGGAESLAAIRAALGGDDEETPEGAREDRRLGALRVNVEVNDEHGPLLRVSEAQVDRNGDVTQLGAGSIALGAEPGHEITLRDLAATLERHEDHGTQLARASIGEGAAVWARSVEPEADEPPQPDEEEEEDGQTDPDQAQGDASHVAGDEAEEENPSRLTGRVRAMLAALPMGSRDAAAEQAPAGPDAPPSWVRRLADGAVLSLTGVTIATRTDDGQETILRELETEVVHRGDGQLHFEGSGTPPTGGSLAWDLELHPLELRAEGTVSFEDLPLALVAPLLPQIPWYEPEHSRIDGELTVSGDATEPLRIEGRLTVRDAALHSPRIAPEPVGGITFTIDGRGTWDNQARRLEVEEATLRMGAASAQISGALELTADHYLVDLTATLPSTDCGTAIAAIPPDLLADLTGFSWQGQLGGRMVVQIDSRNLEETELDLDVADACQFETVPATADLRRVQGPFSHRVLEPNGTWFEMTTGPGTGNWASIYEISPFLIQAVLAHEDASFFGHGGFAPWAIRDALERNLREGRYVVGASTITMQLAKNLFLHREKTLARKVQEVLLTWWLESALDKRGILELYLNVIEYGPGIYGIRNAAWHYFGREPSELSPAESVFLANILPNPKLYHHQYERGELSSSMRNRMQRLLRHMHARGRIDEAALEHGLSEIETFDFHHEGEPPPGPREIPGSAGDLPFATGEVGAPPAAPLWEMWELPPGEVPEDGDPVAAPEQVRGGQP